MPNAVVQAAEVPAGNTRFRWEAVQSADRYVLLQDLGDLSGAVAGDRFHFETYAEFTVMEPETAVLLEVESGADRCTLLLQVFAYAGDEHVGSSEVWAIIVLAGAD